MQDEFVLLDRLPLLRGQRAQRLVDALDALDRRLVGFMARYGPFLLRLALGLVFIWFGALKVADRSPVAQLVADTVYWLPEDFFVRFLGVGEIAIGLGLLLGLAIRLTLLLFLLQMVGTFLVLVVEPDTAFQDSNPLLLSTEGEFVIKNLILITAGLVIGSGVRSSAAAPRTQRPGTTGPRTARTP